MGRIDRRQFLTLASSLGIATQTAFPAEKPWILPFNGKSYDGWHTTGNATWTAEDGCLVGRQGPNGAAGDLFSNAEWADFELECEWWMRFPGNSGIWFRVHGPRTGYQADFIDQPSHPGVLSGSLYCMGKAFIAENRDPTTVNRTGWNTLRIRAKGPDIAIYQNGKRVVAITDDRFPGPGSIGVQIHAGDAFTGMEVRLRQLRIRPI
jgi:hypothetical protein